MGGGIQPKPQETEETERNEMKTKTSKKTAGCAERAGGEKTVTMSLSRPSVQLAVFYTESNERGCDVGSSFNPILYADKELFTAFIEDARRILAEAEARYDEIANGLPAGMMRDLRKARKAAK